LNLAKKAEDSSFDPQHLTHPAERALLSAIEERRERYHSLMEQARYEECCELAGEIIPLVESLFDSVMIMADDPLLRAARLGLLRECVTILGCLGDLSLLVD